MITSLRYTLTIAVILAACVSTAAAGGYTLDDWKKDESSWKDVGVGTVVHRRTTSEFEIPGMPGTRKSISEERQTLKHKDATTATITVERKVNGKWMPGATRTENLAGATGAEMTKIGTEKLTIAGKDYECTKYKGTRTNRGKKEEALFWVHGKDVLKFEGVMDEGRGQKMTWTISKLSASHKVGGTTIAGREVTVKGAGMSGTMLMSKDVPGSVVLQKMSMNRGAAKGTITRELVALTKK